MAGINLRNGGSAFGAGFGRGFTHSAIAPLLQIFLVVENLKILPFSHLTSLMHTKLTRSIALFHRNWCTFTSTVCFFFQVTYLFDLNWSALWNEWKRGPVPWLCRHRPRASCWQWNPLWIWPGFRFYGSRFSCHRHQVCNLHFAANLSSIWQSPVGTIHSIFISRVSFERKSKLTSIFFVSIFLSPPPGLWLALSIEPIFGLAFHCNLTVWICTANYVSHLKHFRHKNLNFEQILTCFDLVFDMTNRN